MSLPHFIIKKPSSPVMTHDVNIFEAMTSLSMFKKLLMIRDCKDPKRLRRHIKYWSTKVENLSNYPLDNEKDRKLVAMFEKLVEFAQARLDYAKDKLEGWSEPSRTPSPSTTLDP